MQTHSVVSFAAKFMWLKVVSAFQQNLDGGEYLGASFCVPVQGETVVDL